MHFLPTRQTQPSVLWSWFFLYILIIQVLSLFLTWLQETTFPTLFTAFSKYFSFQRVFLSFQCVSGYLCNLMNTLFTKLLILNMCQSQQQVSQTTFSAVMTRQNFLQKLLLENILECGSAQLQRTNTKNQDCYSQHQNRMRRIPSLPVLFCTLILFFSSSLLLCIDFFLVEIVIPPSLKMMFLSCISGSSIQSPSVTGEFEQIQMEKKKLLGK